jgi:hypothetical protein
MPEELHRDLKIPEQSGRARKRSWFKLERQAGVSQMFVAAGWTKRKMKFRSCWLAIGNSIL